MTLTKVGFILECGGPDPARAGPDEQVVRHLVSRIRPDLALVVRPLAGKHNLLKDCGPVGRLLLTIEGCACVFIIWDLWPAWREGKPCRREDREAALESLRAAGVSDTAAHLICIREELEAWLLADHAAVTAVLRDRLRPHPLGASPPAGCRHPDSIPHPKARIEKRFAEELGRSHRYTDYRDALPIIRQARIEKLMRSPSFARFRERLLRIGPAGGTPPPAACSQA